MCWNNSFPLSPHLGDPPTFRLKRKSGLTPCRTFVILNNWTKFEKKKKYLINGNHLFIWKTIWWGRWYLSLKFSLVGKAEVAEYTMCFALCKRKTENPELLLSCMVCSLFRKSLINFGESRRSKDLKKQKNILNSLLLAKWRKWK